MKHLVISVTLLCASNVACSQAGEGPKGTSKQEIVNGSPSLTNVGTNAVEIHWPCIGTGNTCPFKGNGIMLNDRWLLTAMHVTSDVFDAQNPNNPNDDIYQPHRNPADISVFFGDSSLFLGIPDLIIDHPRWNRTKTRMIAPFSVDVALVRLKDPVPELAAWVRPLYGGPASDLLNSSLHPIVCSGFGPIDTTGAGTGTLRFTFPRPTAVFGQGDFFATEQDPILNHHFWLGDSGTVCIHVPTQSVAGVFSSVVTDQAGTGTLVDDDGNNYFVPVLGALHVAPEPFREFVKATLGADAPPIVFDVNRQSALDHIHFYNDGSVYTAAVIFGEDGFQDFSVSVDLSFFGVTAPIDSAEGGEFGNGTGFDLAAVINGVLVSVSGTEITALGGSGIFELVFAPQLNFTSLADDYVSVRRIDFNGDSFDDLQALREDGTVDVYVGGANGLEPADSQFGLPTADQGDGKFLIVSGLGQGTYDAPEQSIFIDVPSSETGFSLDVFDGDSGGFSDLGTGNTCFRLWMTPARDQETTSDVPLVEMTSSLMADNGWTSVWSGDVHDEALGGDFYSYRLDVYLASDCDDSPDRNLDSQNRYKVRSTGQLSIEYGTIGFIGVDGLGPRSRLQPDGPSPDFDYDGEWKLVLDVPDAAETIILTDIDADDLDNPPTRAQGQNKEIGYTFEDEVNALLFETVVSGGYDLGENMESVNTVETPVLLPGLHTWTWFEVLAENAVHVHPQGPGLQYALISARTERISAFNSDEADEWEDRFETNPNDFAPLVLGSRSTSVSPGRTFVRDAAQARAILSQAGGSDFAALLGELLAAELNARRPLAGRTDLRSALLYGVDNGVAEVLAAAADAVGRGAAGVSGVELTLLLAQLRTINRGQVTFAGRRDVLPATFPGDDDGDTITNGVDNCPFVPNTDQADWNHDGVGSACEPTPVVRCVLEIDEDRGRGHHRGRFGRHDRRTDLIAFFGFEHHGPELHVSRGPNNVLSGGTGTPVTRFSPGKTAVAFAARLTGPEVVWRLGQLTATASRSSPRCAGFELAALGAAQRAALYADGSARLEHNVVVAEQWDVVNAGHGDVEVGANSRIGDVYSADDIRLGHRARAGVTWANGDIRLFRGAEADGVVERAGLDLEPLAWKIEFPHGRGERVVAARHQDRTLSPGAYGHVTVLHGGRLRLTAGTYFLDALVVHAGGGLAIDTSGGPVVVYVKDFLKLDASPLGATGPENFLIGYFGTQSAQIAASIGAMVVAPEASLMLGDGRFGHFTGRFFAKSLHVTSGVVLSVD